MCGWNDLTYADAACARCNNVLTTRPGACPAPVAPCTATACPAHATCTLTTLDCDFEAGACGWDAGPRPAWVRCMHADWKAERGGMQG